MKQRTILAFFLAVLLVFFLAGTTVVYTRMQENLLGNSFVAFDWHYQAGELTDNKLVNDKITFTVMNRSYYLDLPVIRSYLPVTGENSINTAGQKNLLVRVFEKYVTLQTE